MLWEREVASGAVPRPTSSALRSARRAFFVAGLAVVLLLIAAGCGRSQSAVTETKDDYRVTFATQPAPPDRGDGMVIVTVNDKQGQPVDGARVSVEANMSHAGMMPVLVDSASSQGGAYHMPIKWTMGGSWYVDVKVTLPSGEVVRRRFPVDVK